MSKIEENKRGVEVVQSDLVKAFWLGDPSGDFVPREGEAGYDPEMAKKQQLNRQAETEEVINN